MSNKKIHEIKLDIQFCDAVYDGDKTFEVRLNDRGYQKGDYIKFKPVESGIPITAYHKISLNTYEITYVLSGYGIKDGWVAFGIKEVSE